ELQAQIDELVAKRDAAVEQWRKENGEEAEPPKTIGLTPDDAYHLSSLISWKSGTELELQRANRASELVDTRAADARANYMLPWLVVDKDDKPIFDVETEAGRKRWQR